MVAEMFRTRYFDFRIKHFHGQIVACRWLAGIRSDVTASSCKSRRAKTDITSLRRRYGCWNIMMEASRYSTAPERSPASSPMGERKKGRPSESNRSRKSASRTRMWAAAAHRGQMQKQEARKQTFEDLPKQDIYRSYRHIRQRLYFLAGDGSRPPVARIPSDEGPRGTTVSSNKCHKPEGSPPRAMRRHRAACWCIPKRLLRCPGYA